MGAATFKDLRCWQLSREVEREMYAIAAVPPACEDRDFCDDLHRSARSAPANIAEGFGRDSRRDFAHFLSIARASLNETESHLEHARDIGAVSQQDLARLLELVHMAQKTTARLRRYLLSTPDPRLNPPPSREPRGSRRRT